MPKSIQDLFREDSIHVKFGGQDAQIVPLSPAVYDLLEASPTKNAARPGQVLLAINNGATRTGRILNVDAVNDIQIVIQRNDGSEFQTNASNMGDAAIRLLALSKNSREATQNLERRNADALAAYEEAVARGETPVRPEPQQPEFSANAFARVPALAECYKAAMELLPTSNPTRRDFTANLRGLTRDELTRSELALIKQERALRAEIAGLQPENENALAVVAQEPYAGDREAAQKLFADLPKVAPTHQEMMRMGANVGANGMDRAAVVRLLGSVTTTPAHAVFAAPLSHAGMRTIQQELLRHENREVGPMVAARLQAISADAAPDYRFTANLYTKDDADVLLITDDLASAIYVWDTASRVNAFDIEAELRVYTLDDVPTQESLEALRTQVAALRLDNGAEVDFGWDEAPQAIEGEVLDEAEQIPNFN